jgi:hypothetical protein
VTEVDSVEIWCEIDEVQKSSVGNGFELAQRDLSKLWEMAGNLSKIKKVCSPGEVEFFKLGQRTVN